MNPPTIITTVDQPMLPDGVERRLWFSPEVADERTNGSRSAKRSKQRPTTVTVDHSLLPDGVERRLWFSPQVRQELTKTNDGDSYPDSKGGAQALKDPGYQFHRHIPTADHPANLCSALCSDGWYRPLFDFDRPDIQDGLEATAGLLGVTRRDLVAVNSTRNWHIYVPTVAMSWAEMVDMLNDALLFGIIDGGYHALSIHDGDCFLRLHAHPRNSRRLEPVA